MSSPRGLRFNDDLSFFFFFRKTFLLSIKLLSTSFEIDRESSPLKGGHLDFSHLIELKNVYNTGIYMEKP